MGVLQRFERRLGGLVEGVFARAFKSEVQPVEVAAALQRELDAKAAIVTRDRTLVPNVLVVDLGDHDYERLAPYEQPLTSELAAMVREHAQEQRYSFVGPVDVRLVHTPNLDTGVFHVHSDVVAGHAARVEASPPPAVAPPSAAASPVTVAPVVPRTTARARLVVREGHGAGYDVELAAGVTVLGRGSDADVRLTDAGVSRRHAEITLDATGATLTDLDSTNGTLRNGVRVSTSRLADGDELRMGQAVLVYRVIGDPELTAERGRG